MRYSNKIDWPNGHDFAFTIFDDTDNATLKNVGPIYSFLKEHGMVTTKSVWPLKSEVKKPLIGGSTCEDTQYLKWLLKIKSQGFEIALHNVTNSTSYRENTIIGIEAFYKYFGHYPISFANHADCEEGIYWGNYRLSGIYKLLYSIIKFKNINKYKGHVENSNLFWGDICKSKIKYVRNFTYNDINTLKQCPYMPYHDPLKPFVNLFFASSNGNNINAFNKLLDEKNQDRLEEEGGACIVYTHFGFGFFNNNEINKRSAQLISRLAKKNAWFCTVSELLDFLDSKNDFLNILKRQERKKLEKKWFFEKLFKGSY